MKRLDLENGYVIDIDDRNFTLKSNVKEVTNKDGEIVETSTVHGYYGDMECLFKNLYKLSVLSKGKDTVNQKEFAEILLEAKAEIKELSDKFGF